MASQQQSSLTPSEAKDLWQSPKYLFYWAYKRFKFDIDLAASSENRLLGNYFDEEDNALTKDWSLSGSMGWCNPPYSKPGPWLEHAWNQAKNHFNSVFLIPTPNGDSYIRDYVFGKASEVIFINGRIGFVAAVDYSVVDKKGKETHYKKGDEVQGNTRGSCLVVFNRSFEGSTTMSWVNRDDMKAEFKETLENYDIDERSGLLIPKPKEIVDFNGQLMAA